MSYSHFRDEATNEGYFRIVANYTYDWESWHDPHGKLVWVNDAVERMTGFQVAECLQMPDYPLPIVLNEDRPRILFMLDDALAQRSRNDYEFRILTRAGETRWMAVSWQPMFDDERRYLGFRTSMRDITDRQALKEQLRVYTEHLEQLVQERTSRIAQLESSRRQMEKMAALGELAAGVAHEVNNPLAGIRNAFSLIQGSLPPEHEHYDLLELVDREIERISSIVHQLYQLYRRNPQQASEISLEKNLREVICLLEPIAERHGVSLTILQREDNPDEGPTLARLPEGELKQVLFNVIRNAIQASQAGDEVKVGVRANEEQVEIAVIDEGTGIDDETLPHIFEPFYSTKGQLKEGMGLGLFVTRNQVETMNGKVTVETEPGVGSTFRILLPRMLE